ncbi:MAG: cutinase family protein [Patescibacteria group bacterium]
MRYSLVLVGFCVLVLGPLSYRATEAVEQTILDSNIVSERPCEDVLALFIRGSGQNGGAGNPNNFDQDSLFDFEPESFRFFEKLEEQIHANGHENLRIDRLTLQNFPHKYSQHGYQAIGVVTDRLPFVTIPTPEGIGAFVHRGSGQSEYGGSVYNGAIELAGFLEEHMQRCPNQLIYLGGYSQGADVVGTALWQMHEDGLDPLIERLAHVALYGDPRANLYTGFGGGNPKQPYARGKTSGLGFPSLGARDPYVPDVLLGKFTSWCDRADIICNGVSPYTSKKNPADAHVNKYKDEYIAESAVEMVLSTQSRLADLSGADPDLRRSSVPINGRDVGFAGDVMLMFDTTANMDKVLLGGSRFTLNESFRKITESRPLARAGLVVYNEYSSGDESIPSWEMPLDLSGDVYRQRLTDYSPIQAYVGQYTLRSFSGGGRDLPDSNLGVLLDTVNNADWLGLSSNTIVYFTNSYSTSPENTTGVSIQDVLQAANDKGVCIIPVFYPTLLDSSDVLAPYHLAQARKFHETIADGACGHVSEIYPKYRGNHELYDVLIGSINAPEIDIRLAPIHTSSSGEYVVVPGQQLELLVDATDPDSFIDRIEWDLSGDGVYEIESDSVVFIAANEGQYEITAQATSHDGTASRERIVVEVGTDSTVTDVLPPSADITSIETKDGLRIEWDGLVDVDWLQIEQDGQHIVSLPAESAGIEVEGLTLDDVEVVLIGPGGTVRVPTSPQPLEPKVFLTESQAQAARLIPVAIDPPLLPVYRVTEDSAEYQGLGLVEPAGDSQRWIISVHKMISSGRHIYYLHLG